MWFEGKKKKKKERGQNGTETVICVAETWAKSMVPIFIQHSIFSIFLLFIVVNSSGKGKPTL